MIESGGDSEVCSKTGRGWFRDTDGTVVGEGSVGAVKMRGADPISAGGHEVRAPAEKEPTCIVTTRSSTTNSRVRKSAPVTYQRVRFHRLPTLGHPGFPDVRTDRCLVLVRESLVHILVHERGLSDAAGVSGPAPAMRRRRQRRRQRKGQWMSGRSDRGVSKG